MKQVSSNRKVKDGWVCFAFKFFCLFAHLWGFLFCLLWFLCFFKWVKCWWFCFCLFQRIYLCIYLFILNCNLLLGEKCIYVSIWFSVWTQCWCDKKHSIDILTYFYLMFKATAKKLYSSRGFIENHLTNYYYSCEKYKLGWIMQCSWVVLIQSELCVCVGGMLLRLGLPFLFLHL